MKTTRGRARWLTRITWCAAALALSVAVPSVAAAVPTAPSVKDATVYQGGTGVTIWWTPSTDTQAGAIQYQVYRDDVPMTISNYLANGELVTTTSDTTVTVTPKADELTKKFTYYYMVVATNTTTGSKAVSSNIAPNVHGGLRSGYQTYNCQLCHSVHGAPPQNYLGAATRYRCYRCHGNTSGSTNYGDKAVRNVQRDFFDYTSGQTIPTTVSRHYNAYMETNETECTSCHTPHKSPYYVDPATGVKLDASSYTQLLRAEISDGNYYYSTDAAPSANAFCLQCHGSSSGAIEFNGGTGAYKATAGDHTYAANAVHNETVVYTNNDNHATNPGIQCEACHNKHASAVDKLIDYRGSGTSSTENNQAGLCYKCHRAGTTENRIAAGYAAPYAWNGRDLYAQFAKAASGGSSHPTTAGSGRWTPDSGQVFSQDTDTEFASDTLSQTVVNTADGDGAVVLGQYNPTIDPPSESYLFAYDGGSAVFDQYRPADNAWNASNYGRFNPTDGTITSASGSQLFTAGGKVYVTRAAQTAPQLSAYTPPANSGNGTWAPIAITFNSAFGVGAQATAPNTGSSVVYITAGGGSSSINWFRYDNNTENNMVFAPGGTATNLGAGSAMAYAPGAATGGRLFVLRRNGTATGTGVGNLYYLNNPGVLTGNQNFTNTNLQLTRNTANTDYNRLVYFRDGAGVEYLMMVGIDTGGANDTVILSNLGGASPTATNLNISPFGAALADGCDLKWDGVDGGYIYATRGGANAAMARIAIPAVSAQNAINWGTWSALTNTLQNQDAGAGISFATADPPSYAGAATYYASGTVTTGDITMPSARPTAWGTVSWTENEPANTALSVKVQGWNGSVWVDLVTGATSPIDLSSYSVTTYTKIRLVGTLTTTAPLTSTPRLDDWTVTGSWERFEAGSYVPQPSTAFTQTTQAQFNTDTLFQTVTNTADGDGAVALGQYNPTIDPPSESYLFAHDGGSQTFDQYRPADNAWNANNYGAFDPPANGSFNTASGSQLFTAGGKVYVTRPAQTSPQITAYTPPANSGSGTWAPIAITFNSAFGVGAQATAPNTGSSVVYITAGGGSSSINWFRYDNNTENNMVFAPGGTATNLGAGSAMAYAPGAATGGRLFVLRRNGTATGTGVGNLYYLNNPGVLTGNQNFTNTNLQLTRNTANTDYNRLVYFRDGAGVEYLMMVGIDTGGANDTVILSNLGGASPTATNLNISPFGAALADGCDLKWDGVDGGYIYATRGGANAAMARIAIPAVSAQNAINWGTWSALTNTLQNQDAGAGISFATADPPSYAGAATYYASGTVTTGDILPAAGAEGWGTVSWTETLPANTDISVKVQGWNGSAWVDLVTGSTSPIDISSYSIATYTKLRLVGTLSTTAPLTSTPLLTSWTVTSTKAVWQARGSLTCVNCHNTHTVARGGTTPWDMTRVSNPNSTKNAYTGTPTQFCLECHDASAPTTALNDANVLVPYDVGFTDKSAYPFFPGWNKTATGADWAGGGHATTAIKELAGDIGCDTCHDPHASDNARLTAYSFDQTGANPSHTGTVQRDNSSTYAEQRLCYACHDNTKTGMCNRARCHATSLAFLNAQTPFAATYRHPVELTGKHSDLESGTSGFGSANRHAECADCHDPHATARGVHTAGDSSPGNALRGATGIKVTSWPANWTAVSADSWVTERMTGEDADYEAYVCFKCHSSYSGQPFSVTSGSGTYTSTDVAMEFNPSNFSEHNVLGQRTVMETAFTVGGTTYTWTKPADSAFLKTGWTSNSQLTCTDCHSNTATTAARGPHGSSVRWLLDPAYPTDWKTVYLANTTTEGMNNNTNICAKCHTNLRTANNVHSTGDHQGNFTDGGCVQCHIKIPHGWKRPRLLGYRSDPASYSAGALAGIQLKSYTPTGWQKSNCAQSGCGEHSATVTPLWP